MIWDTLSGSFFELLQLVFHDQHINLRQSHEDGTPAEERVNYCEDSEREGSESGYTTVDFV